MKIGKQTAVQAAMAELLYDSEREADEFTTIEFMEEMKIGRDAAYNRLRRFESSGKLTSRKVFLDGAWQRVFKLNTTGPKKATKQKARLDLQ